MQFVEFAQCHGLVIRNLERDRWARCPTVDHPHKKNGAYFFGVDFGFVQNWATMSEVSVWQDKKDRSPQEDQEFQARVRAARLQAAKEREAKQAEAARKAAWIMSQTEIEPHPYMERKGFVEGFPVWRKDEKALLAIPMRIDGRIIGCQLINEAGEKKFLYGQRTNDAYFQLGRGEMVFICEGFATAYSLQAAIGALKAQASIYACFSANNAMRIAKEHPSSIFIADNDESRAGEKAAKESGRKYWMSDVVGEDFNDYYLRRGLFAASQEIKKLLYTRG